MQKEGMDSPNLNVQFGWEGSFEGLQTITNSTWVGVCTRFEDVWHQKRAPNS